MNKISAPISNRFCPQTLFLYGTYQPDGTPNFGLFCWFSYIWKDGLGVMACIGGEKLTKDLIRKNRVFSANLVSESMLPLADYYGNTSGYSPEKMLTLPEVFQSTLLGVPVISASPWVYELEVLQEIAMGDSDVFLCKIANVLTDEILADETIDFTERLKKAAPVITTHATYFSLDGKNLGSWGEPKSRIDSTVLK